MAPPENTDDGRSVAEVEIRASPPPEDPMFKVASERPARRDRPEHGRPGFAFKRAPN